MLQPGNRKVQLESKVTALDGVKTTSIKLCCSTVEKRLLIKVLKTSGAENLCCEIRL